MAGSEIDKAENLEENISSGVGEQMSEMAVDCNRCLKSLVKEGGSVLD